MKAAIYCRVSRTGQDITIQVKDCFRYCDGREMEVYQVYQDNGISGVKLSRPAFDELLKDMRLYKFDTLVVSKLDRIGRSLKHLLSLFEEFKLKGIHLVAVTQNIDTAGAAGQLQLHILSAFAEYERALISERTKDGLKYAKNVGKRGKDKKPRLKRGGRRNPLIGISKVSV